MLLLNQMTDVLHSPPSPPGPSPPQPSQAEQLLQAEPNRSQGPLSRGQGTEQVIAKADDCKVPI